MEGSPLIISGGIHSDKRGTICFVNDFDMAQVKRFYRIIHSDVSIRRGWRGHRIEQRWFNVIKGGFKVSLVKIIDWIQPDPSAILVHFDLDAAENCILHVPAGYASCLQATKANSEVLVFADFGVEDSKNDDYLFAEDYFIGN